MHQARLRNRLHRASNFARWSGVEGIDLAAMADAACLSPFHFLRVFKEEYRETPIEHITRLRLERAVHALIHDADRSITEIAFDAEFSSSQSFSNAFRRRFGLSPREFRKRNPSDAADFPANQYLHSNAMAALKSETPDIALQRQANVWYHPPVRLAYVRYLGPYYLQSQAWPALQKRLFDWAMRKGLWRPRMEIIGVCPDNSAVTPPAYCLYDLGVAVDASVQEDETVSIQHAPMGCLASVFSTGALKENRQHWRWLIGEGVPQSQVKLRAGSYYEIMKYDARMNGAPRYLGADLCAPVSAR